MKTGWDATLFILFGIASIFKVIFDEYKRRQCDAYMEQLGNNDVRFIQVEFKKMNKENEEEFKKKQGDSIEAVTKADLILHCTKLFLAFPPHCLFLACNTR